MKSYLKIGDHKFPLDEVIEKMGVEGAAHEVRLCQEVHSGELQAGVSADSFYPSIYLDFLLKDATDTAPIPVSGTEQPTDDCSVRSFLYDREGNYFAYSDLDIRPDHEVDDEQLPPEIVVGGQPYMDTIVNLEDAYVRIERNGH